MRYPAKLAPELFDESFISSSSSSPKTPLPPEMPIVQRSDPFNLNIPPLPLQYQLIPFPGQLFLPQCGLRADVFMYHFRYVFHVPLCRFPSRMCSSNRPRHGPLLGKKLKPDAPNPEATHPTDSDHLEPLALLLPAGDFRTSLVLPGCVRFITSTLISIILPLPRAIAG